MILGHHKAAIVDFDKAIQLNLNDAIVYYNRPTDADVVFFPDAFNRECHEVELGLYQAAIADFDKAIQLQIRLMPQLITIEGLHPQELGLYKVGTHEFAHCVLADFDV